nr:thermonuclease family protein [Rhizobium sp. L1K21]
MLALIAAELSRNEPHELMGHAGVSDGDTLTLNAQRVRLKGIDAPELQQQCERDGKNWPCGLAARMALKKKLGGKEIRCSGTAFYRYGRLLALCAAGRKDFNAWMVLQGWAVAYGGYAREEAQARQAGKGVWQGTFERPEVWRRNRQAADEDNERLVIPFLCAKFGVLCAETGGNENETF